MVLKKCEDAKNEYSSALKSSNQFRLFTYDMMNSYSMVSKLIHIPSLSSKKH